MSIRLLVVLVVGALSGDVQGFGTRSAFLTANSITHRSLVTARISSTSTVTTPTEPANLSKGPNGAASSAAATATATAVDNLQQEENPCRIVGDSTPWEVHKFGGASLATAELYRTVGDLLIQQATRGGESDGTDANDNSDGDDKWIPTMAIVSAKSGMTDLLVQVVDSALTDLETASTSLSHAVESQIAVLQELVTNSDKKNNDGDIDSNSITGPIVQRMRSDAQDILSIVQSLRLLHTVPAVTMEVVTGYGEIWSALTLNAYLQSVLVQQQHQKSNDSNNDIIFQSHWMDARDILVVKSDVTGLGEKGSAAATTGVTPLWDWTSANLKAWWDLLYYPSSSSSTASATTDTSTIIRPIVIVTGFVASTANGVPTTLKRSGSDYSATIFAKLVHASRVTMWKNTDGVYTADPRAVPEAFSIASLKYDEAAELAYFGAQVLHPSAMVPCIEQNIPVYVRNIFNPAFEGTVISGRCRTLKEANVNMVVKNWRSKSGEIPIKGITSVDKTSLVTLEGASTIGGANVAERFMGAMTNAGINVLIITQASSEGSITVAVPESQGTLALQALENVFELELARSTIGCVSLTTSMAIVAIVGEGMALNCGVSATFMSSLSRANVNIRLIAQGSSERQIAVVVNSKDTSRALRAAHMAFTLSETVSSVTLLGSLGYVGNALCQQILSQKEKLAKDLGVAMSVNVAACSKTMAFGQDSSRGLDLATVRTLLRDEAAQPFDLDKITEAIKAEINPLRVVVDCTNSEQVADYYEQWLNLGVNIISPGRKVGAGCLERYRRVCKAQRENSVNLYLDSSVGNALPIISTLHDLLETGDTIRSIEGSLSGTMAFVFSTFSNDPKATFSQAIRGAVELDIPENDFRVDLSGFDMAQKVVILAREAGLEINIEDVEIESLLPEEITDKRYANSEDMLADVERLVDAAMLERFQIASDIGNRLRYKFLIDVESERCKCWLDSVPNTDPLYRLKSKENLVAFATSRYAASPLIVKGASAGPDLSAAAIFADLIRLTRAYSSYQG